MPEKRARTPSDRRTLHLDPHILDFLKAWETQGRPPLSTLSPADARNVLLGLQRSVIIPTLPADCEDCTIGGGPSGEIALRLVRPQGVSGALPGVMYFHGGGWMPFARATLLKVMRGD